MSSLRLAFSLAALALASCAAPQTRGSGAPPRGDANYDTPPASINRSAILVGQRQLDEDTWDPLDEQLHFGLEISHISAASSMGDEFGVTGSFDDIEDSGAEIEVRVFEFYGGFRFQSATGKARPFFGLGGSLTYAEVEADLGFVSGADDDIAFGGYIHGGLNLEISRDMDLVFDVRKRIGNDLDFTGIEADIDFLTFSVGVSF